MNVSELEKKLIAAAKAHAPSDRVPYAFEKRVMAYINSHPALDTSALWAQALLRSASACLAVVILVGAISIFIPNHNSSTSPPDLSQQFEKTMLAAMDTDYSR